MLKFRDVSTIVTPMINSIISKVMAISRLLLLPIFLSAFLVSVNSAVAASGAWQGDDNFKARLISAADRLPLKNGTGMAQLSLGLEVKLADGWKIYWRSPGDAGLPPELDFSKTKRVISHQMDFPAPKRFNILGFESFGYSEHVIYPVGLTIQRVDRDITITSRLTGLVCSNICVPIDEVLAINILAQVDELSNPPASTALFRALAFAAAQVPRPSTSAGVSIDGISIHQEGLKLSFKTPDGAATFPQDGKADIFIEAPTGYSFNAPRHIGASLFLKSTGKSVSGLVGQTVTITAVTDNWLLESRHVIAPMDNISGNGDGIIAPILGMVLIAFLGGLILNIMPCVLPIITLKLTAVISLGGAELRVIRQSFLATALGVVSSFLLLGAILAAIRGAGGVVGWGIQFQNPFFLGFSALAIGGFGLVMLDVIRIPIPAFLSRIGGAGRIGGRGLYGDFAAGFLATLLATPCSAPFVGTALTFGFTAPLSTMMVIFFAMGLGLAMPWLLIAAMPQLARVLPRPGAWLIRVKQVLSLGLFATAIWLLSILASPYTAAWSADEGWMKWQAAEVSRIVDDGNVVFVDVTADWCLTCKANKALVLNTDAVADAIEDGGVLLMTADWTHPDKAISQFLAAHGRFGIPFNIIYGPSRPDGIILPELLTQAAVINALNAAR